MSPNAPHHPVVIVQEALSSSAASASTSITRSNSTSSIHSSNSSTSSIPQHDDDAPQESLSSQTRPAQVVGDGVEFVKTGRRQGGNPHGGPPLNETGYFRVSKPTVTVHNSGGLLTGSISTDLGEAYANGLDHTDNCRKMSQRSDNMGLCFCPAGPSSS